MLSTSWTTTSLASLLWTATSWSTMLMQGRSNLLMQRWIQFPPLNKSWFRPWPLASSQLNSMEKHIQTRIPAQFGAPNCAGILGAKPELPYRTGQLQLFFPLWTLLSASGKWSWMRNHSHSPLSPFPEKANSSGSPLPWVSWDVRPLSNNWWKEFSETSRRSSSTLTTSWSTHKNALPHTFKIGDKVLSSLMTLIPPKIPNWCQTGKGLEKLLTLMISERYFNKKLKRKN